jgi:hypothetical protein
MLFALVSRVHVFELVVQASQIAAPHILIVNLAELSIHVKRDNQRHRLLTD